jgi:hypothetical protein
MYEERIRNDENRVRRFQESKIHAGKLALPASHHVK